MTFTFPIHSFLKEEDNQHFTSITIWIIGKNIKHNITEGEIINYIEEDGKSIYNLKITNVEYIEVKIGAEENCLVTIGSTLVHDNYPNNVSLNNSEVYGYLTTDSEEQRKMCYTFTEKSFNFTNKNWFFISMRLFSDVGQIIFTSFNSDYYDAEIIDNGYVNYILNASECKNFIYCINIPDDAYYDIDKIIYSIQISQNNNYSSLLNNPQMLGEFYPRSLQENEFASFIGMNPFKIKDTIRYNIISDTELIDIFFYICDNYPLCFYDDSSINKSIVLSNINLMSSHSAIYNESMTPISPTQNILMVKCKADLNAPSDSSLLMRNSMCKYNTIIYSNDDYIGLLHNRMFNQYIIMNETEKYKISLKTKKNIVKLYIDLVIYSGDVLFQVECKKDKQKEDKINNEYRYQTANKISYYIEMKEFINNGFDTFYFQVKAKKNSFYSIQYFLVKESQLGNPLVYYIPSGVNYLTTIQPTDDMTHYKPFYFIGFYNKNRYAHSISKNPFLINFHSLNCKFKIYKSFNEAEELLFTKDFFFSQDIVDESEQRYHYLYYYYIAEVMEVEQGTYDKKMCMLYSYSIELEENENKRQTLVADNTPQRATFINNSIILKFLYVISNVDNDLGIRFLLHDKAKYNVTFYVITDYIKTIIVSNKK
jgi:hypothetical protein